MNYHLVYQSISKQDVTHASVLRPDSRLFGKSIIADLYVESPYVIAVYSTRPLLAFSCIPSSWMGGEERERYASIDRLHPFDKRVVFDLGQFMLIDTYIDAVFPSV